MVKIRLMGTEKEIVWFRHVLEEHPEVDVEAFSDFYKNKGTNRYYRVYAEVSEKNTDITE